MILPIIILFILVFLFLKKDNTSLPLTEKGKMKSTKSVFRAATGDSGTNNVLVATDKGEIVNESNIAKIDALTTELSGNLNVKGGLIYADKICSFSGGACIELGTNINLVSKDRKNEFKMLDNLDIAHFNNGAPVWSSVWYREWKPTIDDVKNNYIRKGKNYAIQNTGTGHYVSSGDYWKVYAPTGLAAGNWGEKYNFIDHPAG